MDSLLPLLLLLRILQHALALAAVGELAQPAMKLGQRCAYLRVDVGDVLARPGRLVSGSARLVSIALFSKNFLGPALAC